MSNDIKKIKIFNKEIDIDNIDIDYVLRWVKREKISDYEVIIGDKPSKYNVRLNYDIDYIDNAIIEIVIDDCCIGFIKNKLRYIICNCEENREIEMIDVNGNSVSFYNKFNVLCMLEERIMKIENNQNFLVEVNENSNYYIRIGKVNEKYFMCLEILRDNKNKIDKNSIEKLIKSSEKLFNDFGDRIDI